MGVFLAYILKSAICLVLFYLFYRLLLVKDTFHRFNRFALLLSLLFSAILPLCKIGLPEASAIGEALQVAVEAPITISMTTEVQSVPVWKIMLLLIYLLGVGVSCIAFLVAMYRMIHLIRKGKRSYLGNGVILVVHNKDIAPFSWMHYVVIAEREVEEGYESILVHEKAHIHFLHSWDILFVQLALIFQWFNPAAWLLKREIQAVHEFEADDEVLRQGIDAKSYQLLLIKKAVGTRLYSMSNSLNHSSLKKRITMMLKKKSNPWARLKYAYILPLAAITVTAFASPEVSNTLDQFSDLKISDLTEVVQEVNVKSAETQVEVYQKDEETVKGTVVDAGTGKPIPGATILIKGTTKGTVADMKGKFSIQVPASMKKAVLCVSFIGYKTIFIPENEFNSLLKISLPKEVIEITKVKSNSAKQTIRVDDETFIIVENMPEYPGGTKAMLKFIAQNMKYPVEAQKKGVEGRVVVQFLVTKQGKVEKAHVVRSVCKSLDAEAVRVVRMMPNWKPGKQRGKRVNVQYTIPVQFKLKGKKAKKPVKLTLNKLGSDKIMIIANGKEIDQKILNALSPDKIESMTVIKDKAALKKYNAEDKEGVIIIKTKSEHTEINKALSQNTIVKVKGEQKISNIDLDEVLLIVDGNKVEKATIEKMDPNKIKEINVLKGKAAIDVYGEKAKKGVMVITTK